MVYSKDLLMLWNANCECGSVRIEQKFDFIGVSFLVKVPLDVGPINLRQRSGTLVEHDFDQSRIRLLSRWQKTFAAHLFYFRVPLLQYHYRKQIDCRTV